tara:strand:+ start:332 stop:967 length:636 start_codon:yes stop_codon:yes gene_type:complete
MNFLPKEIEEYSLLLSEPESKLLSKLNRETWSKVMIPRMISGHIQGRILSMISKMIEPKNILEIGTYTGYSALCLAEGLKKNGELHTIEINEEVIDFAENYLNKSEFKNQIKQHIGNAIDILPTINKEFQLIFIDADKENYSNYFDLTFEKLSVGGYIIADNVLWSGKVIREEKDSETKAIDNFNKKVKKDKRVDNFILPIRDGLMICRKL